MPTCKNLLGGVSYNSPMKKVSGALLSLSRETVCGSKRSHSPTASTKDPINWMCKETEMKKKKKGYVPVHVWSTGSINQKCRYNYIFTVKHHSHVWSEFAIIVVHYIHQSGRLISTKLKSFPIKYRLHFMGSKGLKQADTFKLVNVWILSVFNWNIEF